MHQSDSWTSTFELHYFSFFKVQTCENMQLFAGSCCCLDDKTRQFLKLVDQRLLPSATCDPQVALGALNATRSVQEGGLSPCWY